MKIPQEDKDRIKQFLSDDSEINVKIGLRLAIGLGMTLDDIIDLFNNEDSILVDDIFGEPTYKIKAFNLTWSRPNKESLLIYYRSFKDWLIGHIKQYLTNETDN